MKEGEEMTRTEIEKELRRYVNGACVMTLSELAGSLKIKNQYRVKQKYLQDDPDSEVPVIKALSGKRYFIKDLAIRLMEDMR